MPSQRFNSTLGANAVIQNLLAGSQFEFVGTPSRVQIYSIVDPADAVDMEVTFGQELQIPASPLPQSAGAGGGPTVPDQLIVDDIAAPGDRIVIRLTETAGAAGTLARTLVVITPLG